MQRPSLWRFISLMDTNWRNFVYLICIVLVLPLVLYFYISPVQRQVYFRHMEDPEVRRMLEDNYPLLFQQQLGLQSQNDATSTTLTSPVVHSKEVVPRIIHFTWYGWPKMQFHHMVCFLSAYHIIKPKKIMFWYGVRPTGEYWEYLRKNITDFDNVVEMVYREPPLSIFGRPIIVPEHRSDIVRLEAVMNHGGIYLDLDVVVLKSFDPLLRYDTTLGMEHETGLCNGVIISKALSPFLRIWYAEYRSFNDAVWAAHSVLLPHLLAQHYPSLIHIENDTINRPNWYEVDYIYYNKEYNWRHNYAMHLWYRKYNVHHDFDSIKKVNSTLGKMFRYVLYGHPDLM